MPKNESSNYCIIVLVLHASIVMLKIIQARLKQYVNQECPDVQAGFRRSRGTKDQIASNHWITKKQENSRKTSTFASLTVWRLLTRWINKLWKILQEIGIPDHLTRFLRNLCAGQESTLRTRHGTVDWFKIGKGVHQGCIFSSCLFNLYVECIMWNAWLNESQAGIKIARRNIRYADDTTLMAESEEKLKSLLMKVKEESEKAGLKLSIQETCIQSWHTVPSFHGKWMGENGNIDRLYFPGLQNHCRWWLQTWN